LAKEGAVATKIFDMRDLKHFKARLVAKVENEPEYISKLMVACGCLDI